MIGLFCRGASRSSGPATVRQVMQPLDGAANLISADAPLIDPVVTAATCPCRLVPDGTEIRGLVTRSDFQRLPVRSILFGLFIHLEFLLTHVLKSVVGRTSNRSTFWNRKRRGERARFGTGRLHQAWTVTFRAPSFSPTRS